MYSYMTDFSGDNRTGRWMGWVEGEVPRSSHGARASREACRAILTRATPATPMM